MFVSPEQRSPFKIDIGTKIMRRFFRYQTVSPDWKCPLYRGVPKERFRCSKTNLNQDILDGTDWPHILKLRGTWGTDKANDNKLMGDFRKNILQTDFERKRNPAKKWLCMSRKKIISPEVWEKKNYYTNQTAHTYPPASKVKWSAPNLCGCEIRHQFPRRYWTPRK